MDIAGIDAALEAAQTGTLFIDEIASLQPEVQFHLLERMDAGTHARVIGGSTRPDALDTALMPDLYYRLDVGRVHIPSLQERPEDIPVLFRHYVAQAAEQSGLPAPEVSPDRLADLMSQDWPGNARALMSAAMRFVLGVEDAPKTEDAGLGLTEQMAQVEQSLLTSALRRQNGQASAAAEALKLPRKTFYDKLARYGIKPETFRN
ncbi:MAG: helix-turn-helix domain-containing protein [Pseudomonadota bacterium]